MRKRMTILAVTLVSGLMLTSSAMAAGVIDLPQTGQKSCWDVQGKPIACEGTGMNGESQTGTPWPERRFTVEGECVTDQLTGLIWSKNADLPDGPMPWIDALKYVEDMNKNGGLCGMTDWRLPNIVELGLLPNKEKSDSAAWLNEQGFNKVNGYNYWSSTTRANHLEHAWRVQMNYGYWLGSNKQTNAYVWPVHSAK